MRVPRFMRSRFVVVPAILAVLIGGWNLYVTQHDHGRLSGQVLTASGQPVPGATVILYQQQFTNQIEHARTQTDAQGRFRFADNDAHLVQLQARAPDGAQSPRVTVRLWFRAQDRVLSRPLIVGRS